MPMSDNENFKMEEKRMREMAYQEVIRRLNEALNFCMESRFDDFKEFPGKEIDQLIEKVGKEKMLEESKWKDTP